MAQRTDQPSLFEIAGQEPKKAKVSSKSKNSAPVAGAHTAAGAHYAYAALVAVASATDLLSYGVPVLDGEGKPLPPLQPGDRVSVPLRGRLCVGLCWRVVPVAEAGVAATALRPVVSRVGDAVPIDLLETIDFISKYYHAPVGLAARLALPAVLRHTGQQGDDAPERQQAWIGATPLPWPADLKKSELRILQRIQNAGEIAVADLRRQSLRDQADRDPEAPPPDPDERPSRPLPAPQSVLDSLEQRGLVRQWSERQLRDPLGMRKPVPADRPWALTEEQRAAVERLDGDLQAHKFAGHLLLGVTGSGKTEVYLQLIAQALALGRGAIVLVPEIALTPELVRRFRARFGDQVAALHSGMTQGERLDQLELLASGQRRIAVGPRSALFAPIANLGVLVVDECHDSSFKQGAGVRYHARDVALVRARAAQAVCVLGSATPGCEEMWLGQQNRLQITYLHQRAMGGLLPVATVVDLRHAERVYDVQAQRPSLISLSLVEALQRTLERGEQAMLLHNRRGFATSMLCQSCGQTLECPDCAITLTWHRKSQRLRCHYCDWSCSAEVSCPHCRGRNLLGIGAGTEKVEEILQEQLPQARMARFDRDTASGQRLVDTLQRFARHELDILVGTQMVAKGHDFPRVTLVGVLLAESGLRVPDFRASERTFQLLTQVAGRSGRGDRAGQVLVQTYVPDHPAIAAALKHDHRSFVEGELQVRQRTGYPPYSHLALLETRHSDPDRAMAAATLICEALRSFGAQVRGPVWAGVGKLQGIFRAHALVRADQRPQLHQAIAQLQQALARAHLRLPPGVDVVWDVDPYLFQ